MEVSERKNAISMCQFWWGQKWGEKKQVSSKGKWQEKNSCRGIAFWHQTSLIITQPRCLRYWQIFQCSLTGSHLCKATVFVLSLTLLSNIRSQLFTTFNIFIYILKKFVQRVADEKISCAVNRQKKIHASQNPPHFLIGRKRTVNFRNQRLWRHLAADYTIIMSRTLKVTCNHVMHDRGAWFLRVIMSSSRSLCCLPSVKKQKHDFHIFFVQPNKTEVLRLKGLF